MSIIKISHLKKYYQVQKKDPGLLGSIKSLIKRNYETVKAVDGISFQIKQGEVVGFIGPNGAGKTTTLKCLSGLLYPDSGKISVSGYTPWQRKPEFLKQIAFVMGQKNQLWWDLPPIETFVLNKAIYQIPDKKYQQALSQLVDLLDAKNLIKKQTRKLSLGQRMKCELIAALLHQPKILFLDEPTIGLDVVMQKNIRDFIRNYNQKHKATIILTSHYMDDVKQLAKRVIMIDNGKIAFDGKLAEISKKYSQFKYISVVLAKKVSLGKLQRMAEVEKYEHPQVVFKVDKQETSQKAALILDQLEVEDLNVDSLPIEEVIRQLFSHENNA